MVHEAGARLAAAPDQFFTAGDVRLRYREIGRGEPVLLLHGSGVTLLSLQSIADSLAQDYRVIALDQRGFGASSKFADPARFGREMGTDAVRLLDHLRVRRAHLIGHSMGASIAAYVAVHHPNRVATVSLLAGTYYADSASAARVLAPVVAGLEEGTGLRAFLRLFAPTMSDSAAAAYSDRTMAANDLKSFIAMFRAYGGFVVGRAGAMTARVPALVVVGSADHSSRIESAREMASWWPRARLVETSATHMSIIQRPDVLAEIRAQLRVRIAVDALRSATRFAHTP